MRTIGELEAAITEYWKQHFSGALPTEKTAPRTISDLAQELGSAADCVAADPESESAALLDMLACLWIRRRGIANEIDGDAKTILTALTKHFGEPVMPIGVYCKGLRTWYRALNDRAQRLRAELFPGIDGPCSEPETEAVYKRYQTEMKRAGTRDRRKSTDRDYELDKLRSFEDEAHRVGAVFSQIRKSALLDRLLYCGEPLRTHQCPTHKGKWSGCFGKCEHGCGLTGWLPEDSQ